MTPIERAIETVGSQAALAKACGVAPALVYQWLRGLRQVPTERCPAIEQATGGAVTCEELRPDLAEHWAYLRGTAKPTERCA